MRRRSRHDHDTGWRVVVLVPLVLVALWGSTRVSSTATTPESASSPATIAASMVTDPPTTGSSAVTTTNGSDTATDDTRIPDVVDEAGASGDADDTVSGSDDPSGGPEGSTSREPVTITAITPWVESEGEFQMRFEVGGDVPADAQITYTIHQALSTGPRQSLRDGVTAVIMGGQAGRILQVPVTEPLSGFGAPDGGFLLSIPVRSRSSAERDRAFLPNAGVHPVSIVLTTADGPELWSTIVFLNHLPRDFERGSADTTGITVGLVTPLRTGPVLASGDPDFDVQDRSELNSLRNLLRGAPSAPLRLALHGDVLAGLAEMADSGEPWAEEVIVDIRTALEGRGDPDPDDDEDTPGDVTPVDPDGRPTTGGGGPELLVGPFTAPDTNGIVRTGAVDVVRDLVSLGRRVAGRTTTAALAERSWVLDDHIGTDSIGVIESMGFDELVVAPDRLQPDPREALRTPSPPPVRLEGSTRSRAVGYDAGLSAVLTNDLIAPVNRSHDVLTALMADWFELDARRDAPTSATSVIIVGPTVDPATAAALGSALDGTGPLRSPPAGSLLAPDGGDRTDDTDRAFALTRPGPTDGLGHVVTGFSDTAELIAAYVSAAPSEPMIDTWTLRNAQSLSLGLGRSRVDQIHGSITSEISGLVASIEAPASRRFVLGARDTTIPLRFRNGLPYDVHLVLHARSPRLEMVNGETMEMTLQPGDNVIDLPVVVRAPGESLLRINVDTPGGDLAIAAVDLPVRSTAISGVGAALSVLSIGFLMLWWGRTFMLRRRERARVDTTHPSGSHADD